MSAKVVSLNPPSQIEAQRRLVLKLEKSIRPLLADALGAMFENADDVFYRYVEKDSALEASQHFDAMRELRLKRETIQKRFFKELHKLFAEVCGLNSERDTSQTTEDQLSPVALDPFAESSLGLLSDDVIEEEVAIKSMTSKIHNRNREWILHYSRYLNSLLRLEGQSCLPLTPKHLAESFASACACLEFEVKTKLLVYKLYEKFVLAHTEVFIKQAVIFLKNDGVVPDGYKAKSGASAASKKTRPSTAKKQKATAAKSDGEASTGRVARGGWRGLETPSSRKEFLKIRKMLRCQPAFSGDAIQRQTRKLVRKNPGWIILPAGYAPKISEQMLFRILSDLQRRELQGQETGACDYESVFARINQGQRQTSPGESFSVAEIDDDTIRLVSLLFEFLFDNDSFAKPVRTLLQKLQLPILKLAFCDKSFFSSGDHPARLFLNKLTLIGAGVQSSGLAAKDPYFCKLEQAVNKILAEFDRGIDVFAECHKDLARFHDQERSKQERLERRAVLAEENKSKVELLQADIQTLLQDKAAAFSLPVELEAFILEGWSRVLMLAGLRHSNQSEEWQNHVASIDSLLDTLKEKQPQAHTLEDLMLRLESALLEVGFYQYEVDSWINEIRRYAADPCFELISKKADLQFGATVDEQLEKTRKHGIEADIQSIDQMLGVMSSGQPMPDEAELSELALQEETALESKDVGAIVRIADPVHEEFSAEAFLNAENTVNALKIGSWVVLGSTDSEPARCRLAAIVKPAQKYIFVSQIGVKLKEMYREQLIDSVLDGHLVPIAVESMFDRALQSVIGTSRQLRDHSSAAG